MILTDRTDSVGSLVESVEHARTLLAFDKGSEDENHTWMVDTDVFLMDDSQERLIGVFRWTHSMREWFYTDLTSVLPR